MAFDDDWVHYRCKTGNTFFIHNKQTGEYRWLTEVNGPELTAIKHSTIATQTDDYECSNGCTSIYVNTTPSISTAQIQSSYSLEAANSNQGRSHNYDDILNPVRGSSSNLAIPNQDSDIHHIGKNNLDHGRTSDLANPNQDSHDHQTSKNNLEHDGETTNLSKSSQQSFIHHYTKKQRVHSHSNLTYLNQEHLIPLRHSPGVVKPNSGKLNDPYSEDMLDVYDSDCGDDIENSSYSEDYSQSNCFDEIPSMVNVFKRVGKHTQGESNQTQTFAINNTDGYASDDDDDVDADDTNNNNKRHDRKLPSMANVEFERRKRTQTGNSFVAAKTVASSNIDYQSHDNDDDNNEPCDDKFPSMVKAQFQRPIHTQSRNGFVPSETIASSRSDHASNNDDDDHGDDDDDNKRHGADKFPLAVNVFERLNHTRSGSSFVANETVASSNNDYVSYNDNDDNGIEHLKVVVGNFPEGNNISSTNENVDGNAGKVVREDSSTVLKHDYIFPECIDDGLESPKENTLSPEVNLNDTAIENLSLDGKTQSSAVAVQVRSQAQSQASSLGQRKAKHQCPICNRLFSQSFTLNRHMRAHANENKLYDCTVCAKKFKDKTYLMYHMRTHTNDKPFACHLCDKRYTLRGTLKDHIARHAGVRAFKCDLCEKTYTRKAHLNEHMKKHNGTPKTLPCPYCGKMFSLQGDVKMHIRIHTGLKPYPCTFCEMKFTHRGNLNRHLQTHTGEKPFECSFCKKSFARSTYLKMHLKKHHGENQETLTKENI